MKLFSRIAIFLILNLIIAEGFLRLQQIIGPVYDLEFQGMNMEELSDVINHKPHTEYHDKDGVRINHLRPSYNQDQNPIKVLFMGDSFMAGYDDKNTIDQHIWNCFQSTKLKNVPIQLYNAGWSSYSPAIYTVQGKQLIPKLKPDFVVVIIDETDLGDDYIRYKNLMVRDIQGKTIAVKTTPLYVEFISGFLRIREEKLYLIRLFRKIYHVYIYIPSYEKGYRSWDPRPVLGFSRDKDPHAAQKYHTEIKFFEENLTELAETLASLLNDSGRILFVYHPHLQHLKPDSDNFYWNNFVSLAVERVTRQQNIRFYNATDDLKAAFGNKSENYYRSDMHFNFDGLKIYGELIAKQLLPIIESMANVRYHTNVLYHTLTKG